MHSVLDLESDRTIAQDDEALEERLRQARPCRFLVHDDGAQLLMVTNKNHLSTSEYQGNHALWRKYSVSQKVARMEASRTWLCGLSGFIDENCPELQLR